MHARNPATAVAAVLFASLLLVVLGGGCNPSISPGKAEVGEIGAACAVDTECTAVSSPTCLAMGASGYCAKDCSSLGQLECPSGAVCEQLGDQAVLCMDGCCGEEDCREGFRCARKPEIDIYQDLAVCKAPGICLLSCTSDASCPQGQVCSLASGQCVARVGVDSGVGAACAAGAQCNSGTCLSSYPGGYCTSPCGTQFTECEPGSECYPWQGGTPTCMARCEADAQCRAGYRCEVSATESNGASVRAFCVPRCDSFGTCPDGQSCDAATGRCQEGAATPGPIGAFCSADAQCTSGSCDKTQPNGYCTASCGTCPAGATCLGGRCEKACANANDCRFSYACLGGGCSPGCTADGECASGTVCDTSSGACVEVSAAGTVQDFKTQTVQISSSGSSEVSFDVPTGAISVVVHANDHQDTLLAILTLTAPGGTKLYDLQDPAASRLTFLPSPGTFTGMFPNGPNVSLVPGTYRVTFVRESGTASGDIRIFGKIAAGFPATQDLPVAFHFLGAPQGISAVTAPADSRFQQAVGEIRAIYGKLGVTLGVPSYTDLPGGALKVVDTVDGANSELSQVFRLGTRDGTLQFFFVDEILGGDDGYTILGVAGGIPGPPGLAGGPHSGVAVTLKGAIDRPALLGQVMAHEGAHYLGLFHTTEATGTSFDPLPDTPQCPASRDTNWDGYVSAEECVGAGSDNFMFWAASGNARSTSPEQGRVVRRNPLTQ